MAEFDRVTRILCIVCCIEVPSPPLGSSSGPQLRRKGLCKKRHVQAEHNSLVALLDGRFGLVPWRPGDDRDTRLFGAVKDLLNAVDDSFVGLREGAERESEVVLANKNGV
jgi:hypothetical protein